MIKLPIKNLKKASNDYIEVMVPRICKKLKKQSLDVNKDPVIKGLASILYPVSDKTEEFLRYLLCKHIACVKRKYPVVRQYMNLCDKYVKTENESLKQQIDIINAEIKKFIFYKLMPDDVRIKLHKDMGIRICPYCNRQYINPMMKILGRCKPTYLGALDHILPKEIYQLLSLSVYNLVPACSGCNSILKGKSRLKILNPWISGFDDDVIYTVSVECLLDPSNEDIKFDGEWKKQEGMPKRKKKQVDNNKKLFSLDEMYKTNESEIRNVLIKKSTSQSYFYKNAVGEYTKIEDPKLLYNVSLDKSKFHEEFMSKLIYDLVKHNYVPVK